MERVAAYYNSRITWGNLKAYCDDEIRKLKLASPGETKEVIFNFSEKISFSCYQLKNMIN